MVILHVVEPFAAGIAVFVKSLTEAMPNDTHIVLHGERRQVMTAAEVKKTFPRKNVRFIRWQSAQRSIHPLRDFRALNELYKILRRLKNKGLVDAVHLHSSKSGLLGRLACRLAGISNVVYTPNGAPFLSGGNFLSNYLYEQLEKIGHGMGGRVVCCSESELEEYEKIGISASYVNNGICLKAAPAYVPRPRRDKDTFRVITSGRIVDQKNPALFNQIARYFEEFPQFEFIWAGDGPDRPLLKASNITVTGWISEGAVKALMADADIYLSTSSYEGLSFAVLEALALRKPMLLSDCVGNKDVIKSGLNGDLFASEEEAIVKILNYHNNREMLQVMGEFSRQICTTEFDMQRNFEKYRDIYTNYRAGADQKPAWVLN
ncbi:MAG TPA: glycosyltransferase [Chitinophagaceae bacterium]